MKCPNPTQPSQVPQISITENAIKQSQANSTLSTEQQIPVHNYFNFQCVVESDTDSTSDDASTSESSNEINPYFYPNYFNDQLILFNAAKTGNIEKLQAIINDKEIDLNATDNNGRTAIHLAALNNHVNIIKELYKAGAVLNNCDDKERTPLHLAAKQGGKETFDYLIKKGVNKEACDINAQTPLYLAVLNGHSEIVEKLLFLGADILKYDKYNKTPLDHAAFLKNEADSTMLQDETRNINIARRVVHLHKIHRILLEEEKKRSFSCKIL